MPKFKDSLEREWDLAIDAPTIQLVRERHQVDLADIGASEQWNRLTTDLVLRVDVLWTVLEEQAKERGINQREFAKGLIGEGLGSATDALLTGIENFFPPDLRSLWRALCQKNKETMKIGITAAIERLNDPHLQKKLQDAMASRMDSELDARLTRLSSATSTLERSE